MRDIVMLVVGFVFGAVGVHIPTPKRRRAVSRCSCRHIRSKHNAKGRCQHISIMNMVLGENCRCQRYEGPEEVPIDWQSMGLPGIKGND